MKTIRILSVLFFCSSVFISFAQPDVEIRVNLGGYPSHMPKQVLILNKEVLDNPIVTLKNEKGETLKEYNSILQENPWAPFSHYYATYFTDFKKQGKSYF